LKSKITSITEISLSKEILTSDFFDVIDFHQYYSIIGNRYQNSLGTDFQNTINLTSGLPTFLRGEAHDAARKTGVELMRRILDRQRQDVKIATENQLKHIQDKSEVNLVIEFAQPIYDQAWRSFIALNSDELDLAKKLINLYKFDTSMRDRAIMDKKLGDLIRKNISNDLPDDQSTSLLALYLAGRNQTIGTLAKSLYSIMEKNIGTPFPEIHWPNLPIISTVTELHRQCTKQVDMSGHSFAEEDLLLCGLETDFKSLNKYDVGSFGAPGRQCIGKTLVLTIWREIVFQAKRKPLICNKACDGVVNGSVFIFPSGGNIVINQHAEE
jgi:hypothetical protein